MRRFLVFSVVKFALRMAVLQACLLVREFSGGDLARYEFQTLVPAEKVSRTRVNFFPSGLFCPLLVLRFLMSPSRCTSMNTSTYVRILVKGPVYINWRSEFCRAGRRIRRDFGVKIGKIAILYDINRP